MQGEGTAQRADDLWQLRCLNGTLLKSSDRLGRLILVITAHELQMDGVRWRWTEKRATELRITVSRNRVNTPHRQGAFVATCEMCVSASTGGGALPLSYSNGFCNPLRLSFNAKHPVPDIDVDSKKKEVDDFISDIQERQQRIEKLNKNLRKTEQIVLQLKEDKIGRKLRQPLTAQARITTTKSHKSK
ncbi:hypothetical protein RR48_14788 [Papilio machaon]|uniref:Uncharacterized protein n=1 Tax=Papilio machaon TaxID=76193 RepID=A0A194R0W1_PAPMA|nr:hypothetical protein RR48_14788 [Papilio machaon]